MCKTWKTNLDVKRVWTGYRYIYIYTKMFIGKLFILEMVNMAEKLGMYQGFCNWKMYNWGKELEIYKR